MLVKFLNDILKQEASRVVGGPVRDKGRHVSAKGAKWPLAALRRRGRRDLKQKEGSLLLISRTDPSL